MTKVVFSHPGMDLMIFGSGSIASLVRDVTMSHRTTRVQSSRCPSGR
jgi:hypothetical protein